MPSLNDWNLPPLEDHQAFERLCLDLLADQRGVVGHPNRYGTSGQAQGGVDILVRKNDGLHAYQCKRVDKLNFKKHVEEEFEKAKAAGHDIVAFHVLTTARSDATVEALVHALSKSSTDAEGPHVLVCFWETIRGWLAEHPNLLEKHYKEVFPGWQDMVAGLQRRLKTDHPTSSIVVTVGAENVEYAVRDEELKGRLTIFTPEANARLVKCLAEEVPASFADGEFEFEVPDHLQLLGFPRMSRGGTLTITPVRHRTWTEGQFVVVPASAHHNLQMFERREKRKLTGAPMRWLLSRAEPDEAVMEVEFQQLPLKMQLELYRDKRPVMHFQTEPVGRPVTTVVEMLELLQMFEGAAYIGVRSTFGFMGFKMAHDQTYASDCIEVLEPILRLGEAADVDILVPESISEEEVVEAERLLDLVSGTPCPIYHAGRFSFTPEPETLVALQELYANSQPPISISIRRPARTVEFLGVHVGIPRTKLTMNDVSLETKLREDGRTTVTVLFDPDSDVLEGPDSDAEDSD